VSVWVTAIELCAAAAAATATARATSRVVRASAPDRKPATAEADPGPTTTLARSRQAVAVRLAGDVHIVLRPVLTEIADQRLLRHGVDLERDPGTAQELLGEALWDVVRPLRPPPSEPLARAVELADLTALIDRLEAI
jgi:hypothetical protein